MKAAVVRTFGPASGIEVVDVPDPAPAPDQLVVEVEAIGVGGVDAVIRRGTLGSMFPEGLVLGSEVAGRVVEVGADVDAAWVGRRVWAFTGVGGGYVERALTRVDDVTPLPDGLSAVDAVAIGSAGPVAHFALAQAHLAPGESVLVRGAAGSLGVSAVQLAARSGVREVAVTTASAERGELLRALGATRVLDRSGDDAAAGGESAGHDVIVDVVGGPDLPTFLRRLAPNGRLVAVGVVGGQPPADFGTTLLQEFRRSLSFGTFSLDTVPVPERNRVRAELLAAGADGSFRAVVHDVVPLADAAQAHQRMDDGEVFGRIVLEP